MRASDFEVRHQSLLHLTVVGAAFLTYAIQPDDVVWAAVKGHAGRVLLERVFGVGTLLIFGSAALQTWARAWFRYPLYAGRILFALGIGLLAPALGSVILVAGEAILVLRLLVREGTGHLPDARSLTASAARWVDAVRQESSKWGLAFTMVIFTLTLKDRLAEVLAGASFLLWLVWNLPDFLRAKGNRLHA